MITFRPPPQAPDWQTVRINSGKCYALPYWYSYRRRQRLDLRHRFEIMRGTAPGADGLDWWKLTGLSFDWWTNRRYSAMISFRWNEAEQIVESGFYLHDNWQVIKPKQEGSEVWMTATIDEAVETYINILQEDGAGRVALTIKKGDETAYYEHDFRFPSFSRRRTRVINPYACGTIPPDKDVLISRQTI